MNAELSYTLMKHENLRDRTKQFALDVVSVLSKLPKNWSAEVFGKQLLRSATSVGANYRAACRAKSQKDFVSKIAIVIEEADESQYWLELMVGAKLVSRETAAALWKEADEIISIMIASSKTAKRNLKTK